MPENTSCDACTPEGRACCALEAVIGVDERGQLVLPKDLRIRAGIESGERLALVSYRDGNGDICCIALVKASAAADAVRSVIEPAIASMSSGEKETT